MTRWPEKPCIDCGDGPCDMNCGPVIKDHTGWGWAGYREGIDYPGRPDFGGPGHIPDFGVTRAKKHLPYVHSTTGNATLIHKVAYVQLRWYQGMGSYMRRLQTPRIHAETVCGMSKFINHDARKPAKMCQIPDPNAVLCGVCHGELPTFSPKRKIRIKKRWAKDHLGCKGIVEVIGPYEPPAIRDLQRTAS